MAVDLEVLRQLKEKAKENREKRSKRGGGGKDNRMAPIVYVPAGTTLLRFYVDSENNLTRTFFRHKVGQDSVHCLPGCPVCKYLSEMERKYPDFQGAWKLGSRETTIAYAWLFSCSEENKFVKLETPVLLMGNHKLGRELNDHIADIEEEEFAKMLDPLTNHAMWELKSGNNGRDFSLAPSFKKGTMDPLPDSLYPLSQCIYPDGQEPSTEQIAKFVEIINEAYDGHIKTVDPDDLVKSDASSGVEEETADVPEETPSTAKTTPKPAAKAAEPKKEVKPAAKAAPKVVEEESGDDRRECYGQHPDGIQPECLLCPDEGSCESATARAANG
jgi:hypothetical protein